MGGSFQFQTCPPGSLFDPAQLICVPENEASCSMNFIYYLLKWSHFHTISLVYIYICRMLSIFFSLYFFVKILNAQLPMASILYLVIDIFYFHY